MQKVACPTTIVSSERLTLLNVKNELSAIPVMIPGSAIGNTRNSETASRPKKRKRATANGMPVAISPARTDSHSAWRISALCQVEANHLVDSPGSGQLCTLLELNAYRMMIAIGKNRNSMISAVQAPRAMRLQRLEEIT